MYKQRESTHSQSREASRVNEGWKGRISRENKSKISPDPAQVLEIDLTVTKSIL